MNKEGKGRICSRKDLRPKLIKGTKYVIDCFEMAERALKDFNMNVEDMVSIRNLSITYSF